MPGQPFRANKYTKSGDEEVICTPAIKGEGYSWKLNSEYNYISYICMIILCIWLFVSF